MTYERRWMLEVFWFGPAFLIINKQLWISSKNFFQNILRKKSSNGLSRFVLQKPSPVFCCMVLPWSGNAMMMMDFWLPFSLSLSEMSTDFFLPCIYYFVFRQGRFTVGTMRILSLHYFLHSFLLPLFGSIRSSPDLTENKMYRIFFKVLFFALYFNKEIISDLNRLFTSFFYFILRYLMLS